MSAMQRTARNDLCPCGSGRKYKACCARKRTLAGRLRAPRTWVWVAAISAAALIAWAAFPRSPDAPSGQPAPWAYDAANNRHWDPTHGHWHSGPPPEAGAATNPPPQSASPALPPAGSGSATSPAPGTSIPNPSPGDPAPWTYDAANNRYWNPEHGHWHSGRPPEGTQ
jgi:hypothetical protein